MKDLKINVSRETRMVSLPKEFISVDGENLQSNLVFEFSDEFVNGTARIEYRIKTTKNYAMLTKVNETYQIPVKNVITKNGKVEMQLVVTEGTEEEEIPVFKSNVFYLYCNESINAVTEQPDGFDLWIEVGNAKLNAMDEALGEVDNLDIDVSKSGSIATVTITKKDGTQDSVQISDGEKGEDGADGVDGKDAKINNVNTLTIEAGDNITLDQEGSTLTISSTATGGTSDYSELENKPSINNVTLSGNKTSSDLGLASSSDIPDLSGYQTKIDSTHKLSADLVDDSSTTNKFVTATDKSNWSAKYDKPSGGIPSTDLSSAVQTSLGKADTALQSETYTGTITSVKMNGTTVASSGEADLGTVITSHQDISGKEDKTNKVTSLSSSSTDTQYPSAKAVYDALGASGGESFFTESSTSFILAGKKKGIYSFGLGQYSLIRIGVSRASYIDRYVLGGILYVLQDIPETAPTGLENYTNLVRYIEYNTTGNIAFTTGQYQTVSGDELYYFSYNQMQLVSLTGDQTISGTKTFNSLPQCSVTPTANNQLVNKTYVDSLVGDISTVLSSLTTVSGGA